MLRFAALASGLLILAACTVSHPLQVPASQDRTSPASAPVSGRYAAHVDTRLLNGNLTVGGACKDVVYPMNMRTPFERRLREALQRRLEAVEFVPEPLTPEALRAGGYAGQVTVVSEDVQGLTDIRRASLSLKAGIDVRLTLVHRVQVIGAARTHGDGPVETLATTRGAAVLDVCESVADTMGAAFGAAREALVGQLDARLAPLRAGGR